MSRISTSFLVGSGLFALAGCTDYFFPPQPPEATEMQQTEAASAGSDTLADLAKDPMRSGQEVSSREIEEDPDEAYRQRQLEREALMKRLEAKQREMSNQTADDGGSLLRGALLDSEENLQAPGRNTALITSMSEEERRQILDSIYQQLMEYQRLGIPPIRDERADLLLPRVYFAFDKSDVRNEYRDRLLQNARVILRELERRGDMILQVEGHADERGNEEYNLVLGHQRANAVRDLLKAYVTDPATLQTVSFGEEFPAVPQSNEQAWSQNRRVMFTLLLRP